MTTHINKSKQVDRLVNRRETAYLLGYTNPASAKRLELAGRLTPIRISSRLTVYELSEVQALIGGCK